jgi:type IV pilus assembly protein PilB
MPFKLDRPLAASHRLDRSLPLIVRLLEETEGFDSSALEAVWEAQSRDNVTVEESLMRANLANERQIAKAYSEHYLTPLFDPESGGGSPTPALATLLPAKLCRDHLIVPVAASEKVVDVALFSPDGLLLLDELKLLTGREVRLMFAPLSQIERWIAGIYEEGNWTPTTSTSNADFQEVDDDPDARGEEIDEGEVVHLDQPPPPGRDGRIIRYVNQVFEQALTRGASDIHIEPFESSCRVRLRIDGALTETPAPPMSMFAAVVARIKVLAKMDIAEKRIPQDGAIGLRAGERRVDMRVNTCPTVHGEKVVLRVLDKDAIPLRLTSLGMDERQEHDLISSIQMPHGLMLVTGPTGSGKSTTLYSCLNFLNKPDVNICTAEDPVEYKFAGINQVQTRSQVGLTFASALRSFLRQDPDVIMVGEVRDSETAEICLRAALTGHFVLSTLHTNDALAAVQRLGEMGIEPFLLASTLRVVVAQRLIRRLCTFCREPQSLDEETALRLGIPRSQTIYRPVGCSKCRDTGYKGRLGAFEVIRITNRLGNLIQRRASLDELRQEAVGQGMKLLSHSAMGKVCEGLTSLEEALSITVSEED